MSEAELTRREVLQGGAALVSAAAFGSILSKRAQAATTAGFPFAEYSKYDALGLAELVRKGEVSPEELLEAAIQRTEQVNPKINAVVLKHYELAREAIRRGLPDGPFRGVPFLLKDLKALDAGQPSSNGSRMFADRRATQDDALVARFKAAGLIVCGRTNTPELGILGVTEPELHGPTRNPWNPAHTPGGSSGGAGAAVAARMVPVAHASDGGGSIRIPASNCGLVGLKPSRHRIPLMPPTGNWGGLATAHVLARTVRDSAGMLDCLQGAAPGVSESLPAPEEPFAAAIERPPRACASPCAPTRSSPTTPTRPASRRPRTRPNCARSSATRSSAPGRPSTGGP